MADVNSINCSDRISSLRKNLFMEPGDPCIGEISLERARIVTKSYQQNPGLPAELQRSIALANVLDEVPIYILDGDLIAGNAVSRPRAVELFPEFGVDWILDEMDIFETREADKYRISEEDKQELRELCQFWIGKTVKDRVRTILGEEEWSYAEKGLVFHSHTVDNSGNNTQAIDYTNTLFKYGVNGIIEQVENKLKNLDPIDPANYEKRVFYRAALIDLKAVIRFAHRYAELARSMVQTEVDPYRKVELETIAKTCEWVPANPPRTLQEALQAMNIIHDAFAYSDGAFIQIPGRADQFLYPYFRKDIDEGRLTKDEAKELIECQFLKYNDSKIMWKALHALYFSGNPVLHPITLGGLDKDGNEAINELSYLILDCFMELQLFQPELAVALTKNTPDEFLHKVCELIRMGIAHPKMGMFDKMMEIKEKEVFDYTIEEIRSTSWAGCGEIVIPGKDRGGPDWAWTTGPIIALELALNNGRLKMSGDTIVSFESGDPKQFKTFDDVWEAWKKQAAFAIEHTVIHRGAMLLAHGQVVPAPLRSCFIDGCIEKGKDTLKGGAKYNAQSGSNVGVTTCGDAFAALKKVIFEDKKYSLAEVLEALDANWVGYEEMQKDMLNAPKFGNDDDYVDNITYEIAAFLNNEHRQYPEMYGGMQRSSYAAVTGGVPVGRMAGASVDGRKAGEAVNEGGLSPHQGRDKKGPTAALKSVAKMPWNTSAGGVVNVKFSANALDGEEGIQALMTLLRTYNQLGGYHVQFNVIDNATLRDAQIHPEKYQNLLVRVGAYCAYYTQLPKVLQDEIIVRTEHASVY